MVIGTVHGYNADSLYSSAMLSCPTALTAIRGMKTIGDTRPVANLMPKANNLLGTATTSNT